MNRSPYPYKGTLKAALAAEQYRLNWLDFYQRMRWAGHVPEERLAEQAPDLMAWHRIGMKRS